MQAIKWYDAWHYAEKHPASVILLGPELLIDLSPPQVTIEIWGVNLYMLQVQMGLLGKVLK